MVPFSKGISSATQTIINLLHNEDMNMKVLDAKFVKEFDPNQRLGCFALLIILSMIGGIVMIVAHYFVAGIPEAIQLW